MVRWDEQTLPGREPGKQGSSVWSIGHPPVGSPPTPPPPCHPPPIRHSGQWGAVCHQAIINISPAFSAAALVNIPQAGSPIFSNLPRTRKMFSRCIVTVRFLSAQSPPIIALISESLTRLVPWLAVRLPGRPPSGGLSEFSRFCGFVTNTGKAGGASRTLVLSRAVAQADPSVFQSCSGKQAEPDREPRLAVRRGGSWGLIGSGGLAGRCLRST